MPWVEVADCIATEHTKWIDNLVDKPPKRMLGARFNGVKSVFSRMHEIYVQKCSKRLLVFTIKLLDRHCTDSRILKDAKPRS
jgi:hypothetical protein